MFLPPILLDVHLVDTNLYAICLQCRICRPCSSMTVGATRIFMPIRALRCILTRASPRSEPDRILLRVLVPIKHRRRVITLVTFIPSNSLRVYPLCSTSCIIVLLFQRGTENDQGAMIYMRYLVAIMILMLTVVTRHPWHKCLPGLIPPIPALVASTHTRGYPQVTI